MTNSVGRASLKPSLRPPLFYFQDVHSLVLIADVNTAPPIDNYILRLLHEFTRFGADSHFWIGRNEIGDLLGHMRIADIVNSQTGIEIGEVGDVVATFEARLMIRMMLVMWSEATAFGVEICQTAFLGRDGQRKERHEPGPGFFGYIDNTCHVKIFVAVFANRFVIDQNNLATE